MPYHLQRSQKPRGWFVEDDNGRKYSKKPHQTKQKAMAQLKALYMHANHDVEGEGLKEFFSNIAGRFTGIRDDYRPQIRSLLKSIGDKTITGITIYRKPIESWIQKTMDVVSLGRFSEEIKKKGYDKLFHLFMRVDYDGGSVIMEKNEVINIKPWKDSMSNGAEMVSVPLQGKQLTIKQFLDNGKKQLGSNFYTYDAFKNNCQSFLKALLDGNGLNNKTLNDFIYQYVGDIKGVETASKLAKFITDTASRLDTFIYGKGLI